MTEPVAELWAASAALAATGEPLMARVLRGADPVPAWEHFPRGDVVSGPLNARYFYHCHNPGDRGAAEHGHFHLFVGKAAFARHTRPLIAPPDGRRPRPALVHVAGLSVDHQGLPTGWFAPNRWVTDEWLYPADAIIALLPDIAFEGAAGDPLVNRWLTAMLHASLPVIGDLLRQRDLAVMARDRGGEDRDIAVLAQAEIDLDAMVDA